MKIQPSLAEIPRVDEAQHPGSELGLGSRFSGCQSLPRVLEGFGFQKEGIRQGRPSGHHEHGTGAFLGSLCQDCNKAAQGDMISTAQGARIKELQRS